MKYNCALIVVSDMSVARNFYENVLGQKVLFDFGANVAFVGGFALQTKESWADFIEKPMTDIGSKTNNFELYFEEENIDAFMERLNTHSDIEYLHEIREYPWGQRAIRFYDPDLNIIEVGESMKSVIRRFVSRGLSVEETAKRTQHPIEFVQQCLL